MTERLGLGIIPGVGWRASEIRTIAREAEDAGFDAIVTAEVNNDSLATAQLMGEATRQIKVGTWISMIHMRHSYACAKAASLVADATGGRMILGLGVSHQPVNAALGVDMPSPTAGVAALRDRSHRLAAWRRTSNALAAGTCPGAGAALPGGNDFTDGRAGRRAGGWRDAFHVVGGAGNARVRCGLLVGARKRRPADRWTWRSVSRPLSETTSRLCATRPARTLPCSRPSRSISGCFGPAALRRRPLLRSRVPAATR